ncbi:class II aldolase/adducin family protein, partial [Mycobacterium tuberculosis]|nr:class II aldolase/adducin family protein [Mycobacterium tuberculosis]
YGGLLEETDIMVVDLRGRPVGDGKPSAETLLHTPLYQRYDQVGAVLHTHSPASTVLTMHWPADRLTLEGYELLNALEGITTHDTPVV